MMGILKVQPFKLIRLLLSIVCMISFFLLRQTVSTEIEFLLNTIIRTTKLIHAQLSFLDIIDNHLTSTSISVETPGASHGMKCF